MYGHEKSNSDLVHVKMISSERAKPVFLVSFLVLLQETAPLVNVVDPLVHTQQLTGPLPYSFGWQVNDAMSTLDYAHQEYSNGKTVAGFYRTLLPDNRVQIVGYKADENGYTATVRYERPFSQTVKVAIKSSNKTLTPVSTEFTIKRPTKFTFNKTLTAVPSIENLTLEDLIRLNPKVPVYYPQTKTQPKPTQLLPKETPTDSSALRYRARNSPSEKKKGTPFPKLPYEQTTKQPYRWRPGARAQQDLVPEATPKVTEIMTGCLADSVKLQIEKAGKSVDITKGYPSIADNLRYQQASVYFPQFVQKQTGENPSPTRDKPPNSAGSFRPRKTGNAFTHRPSLPFTKGSNQQEHPSTSPPDVMTMPSQVWLPANDRVHKSPWTAYRPSSLAAQNTALSSCKLSGKANCLKNPVPKYLRDFSRRQPYNRFWLTPLKTTRYARLTGASQLRSLQDVTKARLPSDTAQVMVPKRLSYPERNQLLYQLKRRKSIVVPAYVPGGQSKNKTDLEENQKASFKVRARLLATNLPEIVKEIKNGTLAGGGLQKSYSKITRYSTQSQVVPQP